MLHAPLSSKVSRACQLLAAAAIGLTSVPAHATTSLENTQYSDDPAHPTVVGSLTLGTNLINGAITTYGTPVGPHGELSNPDVDYLTFTVPNGFELTQFLVMNGTTIQPLDRVFLGLASGTTVNVDPSFTSAAGLLGWTLVSQSQLGTDILPAIGASAPANFPAIPGATMFTGPLGAGTYTLWLQDANAGATYSFNLVLAAVPEPATWMQMLLGFTLLGTALRFRRRTALLSA
jgi:hypothetical protein